MNARQVHQTSMRTIRHRILVNSGILDCEPLPTLYTRKRCMNRRDRKQAARRELRREREAVLRAERDARLSIEAGNGIPF